MKSHIIMVMDRFAPFVRSGAKFTTIRRPRKREIVKGDRMQFRRWEGKPYRSRQIRVLTGVCVRVSKVHLLHEAWGDPPTIRINGVALDQNSAKALARCEGFVSVAEMFRWFGYVHGLPFRGNLYRWRTYGSGENEEANHLWDRERVKR